MEERKNVALPENAGRELRPGESYEPILKPEKKYAEATPYSVAIGLVMVILFSAAAAYLGLKVGQVFEAAIPIAIMAVGLTGALGLKQGLSQNVIIQSIGGCSGAVVAGPSSPSRPSTSWGWKWNSGRWWPAPCWAACWASCS